jgi:DNA-binding transcriptional MerR regulator
VQIAELARQAGVATSTVRYYERIGLLPEPARTASGYRSYGDDAPARLLFVIRAKHMGLSLEQIAELLPIWDGVNCAATHDEITRLVEEKRTEIVERIEALRHFADQLDDVARALEESPPPSACLPDLSCCLPETGDGTSTPIVGLPTRRADTNPARPD